MSVVNIIQQTDHQNETIAGQLTTKAAKNIIAEK